MNIIGIGTITNVVTILLFSFIGVYLGKKLPATLKETLLSCIGLICALIGVQLFLKGEETRLLGNIICLIVGAVIGELLALHQLIEKLSLRLQARFASCGRLPQGARGANNNTFALGLAIATIFFLTGDMFIVGSIQEGATGNPTILFWKSPFDAITACVLAAEYGIGVALSAGPVAIVQGLITLMAYLFASQITPEMIMVIRVVGGIILFALGLNVMNITKLRVMNLMPAIPIAIIWEIIRTSF